MIANIETLEKKLSTLGENHKEIIDVMIQLSKAYLKIDELKSLKYGWDAHKIAVEISGKIEQLNSTTNLADLEYQLKHYETSQELYQELLILAEDLGNMELEALSYCRLGFIFWYISDFASSEDNFLKSMEFECEESLMAENYEGMGLVSWRTGKPEIALQYYHKALLIQEKLNNESSIANIYNYTGIIHKIKGEFDIALDYYRKALAIQDSLNENEAMAKLLNNIGNIYLYQGKNEEAIEYYLRALEIAEFLDNFRMISSIVNNVGLIYLNMEDFEKSLSYLKRALNLRIHLNSQHDIAHSLNNVGIVYQHLGQSIAAAEHLEKALAIEEDLDDKSGMACTHSMLGICYLETQEYDKALKNYKRSRKLYENIGDRNGIAASLINEGGIAFIKEDFAAAQTLLDDGLKLSLEINATNLIKDSYKGLMELYKAKCDYKNALDYYEKFIEITEILSTEESKDKIAVMQDKYEKEKKEREAEIYHLKNVELAKSNSELHRLKEHLEIRIAESLADNRKKESMIVAQSRQAAMGQMINFIAHQWKQPLSSINAIIQNVRDCYYYDELTPEKIDKETDLIMQQVKFLADTIDEFRDFFKPDKEREFFNIKDIINRTIKLVDKSFLVNNIELVLDISDNCLVNGFPNEYSQVVLNIFNNAREAFRDIDKSQDKFVKIILAKENDKNLLLISNNAGCIANETLPHVFEAYYTTKGSQKGSGLGLYMSKTIIEEHFKGKLSVKNIDNGVEFRIET